MAKQMSLAITASEANGNDNGMHETPIKEVEVPDKIKELLRLAHEQGYLTYGDVSESFSDNPISPEQLGEVYSKLRGLEVDIVDQAEVDRIKTPEPEEGEEKSRLDVL